MITNRARPALCRNILTALTVIIAAPAVAAPPVTTTTTTTTAAPEVTAPVAAQAQIARLRQTANQLRLLAHQPQPTNAAPTEREEHMRHRQWLHEAGERVRTLADNWEQRLGTQGRKGATPARDVNAFFAQQTAGLQSRLDRESASNEYQSALVRAARDTARVVIGHMH